MRIAGLASNDGRNLLHLHNLRPGGASVEVILTNDADASVLETAAAAEISTEVIERTKTESRQGHERRINAALAEYEYDLVCVDGYTRVLSDEFLEAQPTTLNVHPSLLPSFPGMEAWRDALDTGVDITGSTVHVVADATDDAGAVIPERVGCGPIITQEAIPVYEGDDAASLRDRIRTEASFKAYPRAVKYIAEGRVEIDTEAERATRPEQQAALGGRHQVSVDRVSSLRYGENPHQSAALYADYTSTSATVVDSPQLNDDAKAMSYNNYNDADAALTLIKEFDQPAAAVIKHTNPAGVAVADSLTTAYRDALSTDPKSAFGGVVALNRECDATTAAEITDSFKEVVVAPGYTDTALTRLREKDNLRVLAVGPLEPGSQDGYTEKTLTGGRLVQERDYQAPTREDLTVVTDRHPTDTQYTTLQFAWQVIKHVKSNAIVFAKDTETVGIGAGQVSRVDAVEIAKMKAQSDAVDKTAAGAVMASDAFFPFPDGIEAAAEAGIEAVIQPGGSVNDEAVIDAANDHDMAMVFTDLRAFRHD